MGCEGKQLSGRDDSRASRIVQDCGHSNYRTALELLRRGLTVRERRGRFFYHRLTRAAEDALLLAVVQEAEIPTG